MFSKSLGLALGAVSATALGSAVFAQSGEQTDDNVITQGPEPRVIIENSEGSGSNVEFQRQQGVDLNVEQEEAQVDVQQSGEAEVQLSQEDPQINIEQGEEADVQVSQPEPQVILEHETDEQQSSFRDMRLGDIEGQPVTTTNGERLGEIEQVGLRGETVVLIIGVGGFLGLGERTIALPLDRLSIVEGRMVLDEMTTEEIESMPEFEESEFEAGQPDQTVGELVTVQQ